MSNKVNFYQSTPIRVMKKKYSIQILLKKFNFEVSHGGKIVEDLSNSEICIAQQYGSVIDHCIFMKKNFFHSAFHMKKNFSLTKSII